MKTICLLIVFIGASFITSQAQNIIAVQNGSTPVFYGTLDAALTNAKSGDTLFLPGCTYSKEFTIDKKLHIIGVGHNPDSTLATGITRIIGNISLVAGSDNGSIEGIYLDGIMKFGTTSPSVVTGFSISRCNLGSVSFIIDVTGNQVRYSYNSIVESIVREGIATSSSCSSGECAMQMQSIRLENCIVLKNGIGGLGYNSIVRNSIIISAGAQSLKGCTFDNNVILGMGSMSYCVLKNNLCTSTLSASSENLLIDNLVNQSLASIFVKYPTLDSNFSYGFDFHLKSDCVGKKAGTDGTDIGIYGGALPWKDGGFPSNPHIQFKRNDGTSDREGKLNLKMVIKAQER